MPVYHPNSSQRTAVKLDFGRHLRAAFERAQRLGKSLPIAVCIGTDLAVHYAAATMGSQMPESTDELAIAGGLRGEPAQDAAGGEQEPVHRARRPHARARAGEQRRHTRQGGD